MPTTEVIVRQMLVLNATAFRLPQYHNIHKGNRREAPTGKEKDYLTRIRSRERQKSFPVDMKSFHI